MRDNPFAGTSVRFRLFYGAVVIAGLSLALLFFPGVRPERWLTLAWWAIFIVAADISAIRMLGGRAYIAVSSSLDYAAIALFGPVAAALVEVASTIVTQLLIARRPLHRVLFNLCLFVIVIMSAGYAFTFFGGEASDSLLGLMLPLGICGLVYFAANTGGVSLVVALHQRENPWRVWHGTYAWTLVHLAAFVPLGALIIVVFREAGLPGVGLFLLPLLLARYTFKLYTDMRQEHIDTVRALTSAIDASDPFTKGHSERVAAYSTAIAREMGLSEPRVMTIEYASLIHDMGKIALQHDILLKPGALTDEEWAIMRTHPETGARIVANLHFLRGARDVVLYHHERIDGKGYPAGLEGKAIPLEARIVKVADAFDAMMSTRPYRESLGFSNALSQLDDGRGTEFDPEVVKAFLRLLKEGEIPVPSSEDDSGSLEPSDDSTPDASDE
jgi:hypothetical protein